MSTIPARLARAATSSRGDPVKSREQVIKLYRNWYRSAPEICTLYALNVPASLVRSRVREQFEKNRHITDPNVIDMLLIKGHNEWQETMNCWKMESHVLGILLEERKLPQRSFMDKFLEGRDDDGVIPASPA
ncbi:unnamed protein product [Peniophora sp. CBMAI 1063]|nr:unnamed protein product [Peniophora sp. CBMAI 1063]